MSCESHEKRKNNKYDNNNKNKAKRIAFLCQCVCVWVLIACGEILTVFLCICKMVLCVSERICIIQYICCVYVNNYVFHFTREMCKILCLYSLMFLFCSANGFDFTSFSHLCCCHALFCCSHSFSVLLQFFFLFLLTKTLCWMRNYFDSYHI